MNRDFNISIRQIIPHLVPAKRDHGQDLSDTLQQLPISIPRHWRALQTGDFHRIPCAIIVLIIPRI